MKPMLFAAQLKHRNFIQTRDTFTNLVSNSPGNKIIALVGPTQIGKSTIFEHVVEALGKVLHTDNPAIMPFISLTIAASQDGRISPKHLSIKLLKALRHPMYMHIGAFDEQQHYRPSRGRDEGSMRDATEVAMEARSTMYSLLDEAHHLTHTKDREVRSNVLQSIKCLMAINRTLALVGGYELAYRGLFDSAHFVGRVICVEFAPYADCEGDIGEWNSILKFFSERIPLSPKNLLIAESIILLNVSNGSFGLLEKILWTAHILSCGKSITRESLRAAYPTKAEHDVIRRDIVAGQKAISKINAAAFGNSILTDSPVPKRNVKRPFQRNPNRILNDFPVIADE
ncbi:AAA family ATPase [Rhodanobacter soli]